MVREIEALVPCCVSLLTERRLVPPYGLAGGEPGAVGHNVVVSMQGDEEERPGKGVFDLEAGQAIRLETPGGGGYGRKD